MHIRNRAFTSSGGRLVGFGNDITVEMIIEIMVCYNIALRESW